MKLNAYIKNFFSELESAGGSLRHASQNCFFGKLLIKLAMSDKNLALLDDTEVLDDKVLDKLVREAAFAFRRQYGFEHDKASIEASSTEIYKAFVVKLQASSALALNVLLYKTRHNELAVKFPAQIHRDRFIGAMGGLMSFSEDAKFLAGKTSPMIYPDNNNTLYIHGYIARNGEVAAVLCANEVRDKFVTLLDIDNITSTYPGQDALYINERSILKLGSNIRLKIPHCCTDIGYAQLKNNELRSFFIAKESQKLPGVLVDIILQYSDESHAQAPAKAKTPRP